MRALKIRRSLRASAAALLLAAAFPLAGPATAAHAVAVDVLCKGQEQDTFTPGLTLQPQLVHLHADQRMSCTSTDPTLTGRTETFDGTFTLSCLTPFFSGPVTLTFHWNNGRTSTASGRFAASSTGSDMLSIFKGKATAGEFQGDSVETVLDVAKPTVQQCAQPGGLTHESGVYTATFQKP
ncbi:MULTISPECIES: hypothetical protein [unclassified Streptomyces]|uniref:hypothetical protein n=1 Tax=unclassified Streptomyces TaxID=2593676 RepID=UPI00039A1CE1|nr:MULTISPECIES: hypothetical protein [unclassified Streptomyces]MYT33932.1 hypothetical protein [Streptomyces sp. SID8354]